MLCVFLVIHTEIIEENTQIRYETFLLKAFDFVLFSFGLGFLTAILDHFHENQMC